MPRADHDTISVSRFKATCLAVLERVRRTGRPVYVTRRGELLAEVLPPSRAALGRDWLGSMEGTVEFVGDVVAPVTDPDDWDVMRG